MVLLNSGRWKDRKEEETELKPSHGRFKLGEEGPPYETTGSSKSNFNGLIRVPLTLIKPKFLPSCNKEMKENNKYMKRLRLWSSLTPAIEVEP